MKIILKSYAFCILSTSLLSASAPLYAQTTISEAYCQSYLPVVRQAIYLRKQGIPIDSARDSARSAFESNRSLGIWLVKIIDMTYSDPDYMLNLLDNGNGVVLESCTSAVRGY